MAEDPSGFKVGDTLKVVFADGESQPFTTTVREFSSDAEEGFGPEIEDYVACWVDVQAPGKEENRVRSITLKTDFQYYLDGRRVTVTKI